MADKIQLRRGLSTFWTSTNPVLSQGEIGIETDTGRRKIGDGTTAWTGLGYDDLHITPLTEIGAALVDADEIPVYDASATGNRKSLLSRIWTYISGKLTATANTFTANQIISVADNTNAALRITQTGTGNCLVVEDSAHPDSTPFVIDNNGKVFIGNTQSTGIRTVNPSLQFNNFANNSDIGMAIYSWGNHNNKTDLQFIKSRSTSASTNSIVLSADYIGAVSFSADNGVGFVKATEIVGGIDDSVPSLTSMPGRLTFLTTPIGATSPSERLRINSSGNVGIGTTTISARTHIVHTAEQLRLGYDATKYVSNTVDSSGNLTIDTTGGTIYTPDTIENTTAGAGMILKSPDGTRYRITVANGGTLTVAAA